MPHLVASLTPALVFPADLTLACCHTLLRDAHDYLARRGMEAARRATLVDDASAWGGAFKRVRVALPPEGRPAIVRGDGEAHSLAEVVNQCATMERLLDALAWAQTEASGMSDWTVARCHPTTSSAGDGDAADHDLVLVGPADEAAWFEVSDVASASDGNRKEERDLRSLGVLGEGKGDARFGQPCPAARVFLVVSTEFALPGLGPSLLRCCPASAFSRRRDGDERRLDPHDLSREILHRPTSPLSDAPGTLNAAVRSSA